MFNVRVKKYLTSVQTQVFSEPVRETYDMQDIRFAKGRVNPDTCKFEPYNVDVQTGEIFPMNWYKFENPFTEKVEFVHDMDCKTSPEESKIRSARRAKNMIYDIAKSNYWEYFITFTFDPEKVNSFDYSECTKKLSFWFKNMRKKCPDMRYLVVPEQHESGRWHFHGLFASCDALGFVDSGHRDKRGKVIYNVGKYKFGFTTAVKIDNLEKTCSYIAKYVTYDLCAVTKGKRRYWASKNVDRPVIEEYLLTDREKREIIGEALLSDDAYVKNVVSDYTNVTYVETPIYTTNSVRFRTNDASGKCP